MNTFDSSATARPRIGLVELPELAGMLQSVGIQTITGPGFREAATEIKAGFKESTFPIVVADATNPGLKAWIQRIQHVASAAGTPVEIAVLREGGDPVIVSDDVIELRAPVTLNQVLAAVKLAPVSGGEAIYPAPVAAPAPTGIDLDFDFDDLPDEEPAAPAHAAPVQAFTPPAAAPAAPVATPAPAVETPPWETADVQAPASDVPWEVPAAESLPWEVAASAAETSTDWGTPATPATDDWSAPAPVEMDWGTPAAPAAVDSEWDVPAPAAAPAPAEADPWDTPAVATAQQATPTDMDWGTPAAPVAQPAVMDIDWGTPAADPAPAPAAAQEDEWDTGFPAAAPVAPAPAALDEWDTGFAPAAPVQAPAPSAEARVTPAPAVIDWGTPAAQSPETDRPEPWTDPRAFTPAAPPAVAQTPVPAPVTPVREAEWDTVPAPGGRRAAAVAPDLTAPAQPMWQGEAQTPVPAPAYTAPAPVQQQMGWQQPQAQDAPGIFDQSGASRMRGAGRFPSGEGALVVNYSGKGGVGKSTTSLRLASIAADAGLKVILIDGNAAQGDLRTYMRLHRANLPTIYDAALGEVSKAVLLPEVINENRERTLGKVNFAFVAAAPDEIYDKNIVTDAVYGRVIEYARRNADLVILDTQIVEAADRSGVVDDIILPALVQDGWGIGISDMSSPGVNNLNHRLHKFINNGVPTSRLMVLINRVPADQLESARKASEYFRGRARFLGVIEDDFQISQDMNAGRMEVSNRNLNKGLNEALYVITGNEAFAASEHEQSAESRGGLFSRFFGRREAA